MKKYSLILVLLISIVSVAQVKIKVNPNVGLTFSQLSDNNSNKIRMSYVAGVDLRFGKRINFVPGLYFGNVGTDLEYTENSATYEIDNSINTLQLRTLLAVNVINTKALRIRLIAGPALHYTIQSLDIEKDNIKNAIAFLNFGAGVDLGFFTIDARYEYGLTSVFDESGTQSITIDSKNNILIISVGLVF